MNRNKGSKDFIGLLPGKDKWNIIISDYNDKIELCKFKNIKNNVFCLIPVCQYEFLIWKLGTFGITWERNHWNALKKNIVNSSICYHNADCSINCCISIACYSFPCWFDMSSFIRSLV